MFTKPAFSLFLFMMISVFALHPVAAQQVIIPFQVGQQLIHSVSVTQVSRSYQIREDADNSLFVLAVAQDFTNSPSITLINDETNRIAGMMSLNVSGVCFRIAPGNGSYTLTASSEDGISTQIYGLKLLEDAPTAFSCNDAAMTSLAAAVANATETSTNLNMEGLNIGFQPDEDGNPIIPGGPNNPGGPNGCQAASGSSLLGVNIRALASTSSNIIGNIALGDVVDVLGVVNNANFLLVDNDGLLGFASKAVVQLGGNCSSVPVVNLDGTVVIDTGDTIDLGVNLALDVATLIDAAVAAGATVNGNGVLVNLNAEAGTNGSGSNILDVDGVVNLDNGGLNVDAGVGLGDTDIADISVNLNSNPNGPIIDVQLPVVDTEVTIGGGSCIVVLGIRIGC